MAKDIPKLVELFQALASNIRIRLLSLLNVRAFCVDELSEILQRSPGTINHHLRKLLQADLVTMKRYQYYHYYQLNRETWGSLHEQIRSVMQLTDPLDSHENLFSRRVFATFFTSGRFIGFPPQAREKELLLRFFRSHLRPDYAYSLVELEEMFLIYSDLPDQIIQTLIDSGDIEKSHHGLKRRDTTSGPDL